MIYPISHQNSDLELVYLYSGTKARRCDLGVQFPQSGWWL